MLTNTERQQIVEEVNAGTYGIDEALDDIAAAQKGEEVRKALYAEALVLNHEGHAGSTDMIARQQIANLQTSVNGQISTLRTEVGDDIDDLETALNSGLATQDGKIAAQNATIANVVANYNVEYGSTELWASTGETGALAAGTTVTLSEDVSHFDYIDIYSFCGNSNVLDTVPVDAKLQSSQGYALRWVNLSDPDSGSYKAYVRIIETRLHIIGTTLTIDHQVTYRNGEEVNISGAEITQSNRSTYMGELGIMKIVGRKITANTEIEDVRIGADGTEYASAGQAVRAQVTALESAIPAVDSTLSTQGAAADAKIVGDELTNVKADLAQYEDIFTGDVGESVSNWLDLHPEATTTVEDGSLTEAKFSESLKLQTVVKNNVPVIPTMYGEYMGSSYSKTETFNCVAVHEGYVYAFEQIENDLNNAYVKIFNISTNQLIDTKTINGGHCNSVCVYNDQIYLVPSFVYDGATPTAVNEIRIFDTSLTLLNTINTPTQPMGVSYDATAETLYYFDYAKDIYQYENGVFSKLVSTGLANLDNKSSYNQDFCVNNGMFFVSSPSGKVLYGDVKTGTILGAFDFGHNDNFGLYMLGEVEGFEFFDNVLYVAWYSTTPSGLVSFILKYDLYNMESLRAIYGVRLFSDVYVADDYKIKFKLNQNQIHCLEMLYLMTAKYKRINLDGTYTCDGETFQDFELYLNDNTLNAKSIRIIGLVGVHGSGTINVLANNTFNCVDGVMRFMGNITITSDGLSTVTLLTMGNAKPISAFANAFTTNLSLKIGSSTLTTPGFYFGEKKVSTG